MLISNRERDSVFAICEQLLSARSERDIVACICGPLKKLVGFRGVFGGLAKNTPSGLATAVVFGRDFPEHYLSKISSHGRIRPQTLQFWARERKPLALNFARDDTSRLPRRMMDTANRYQFYNMLCHGQVNPSDSYMSYVTLTQIDETVGQKQQAIAAFVMPHLHNALQHVASGLTPDPSPQTRLNLSWAESDDCLTFDISTRQKQVLYLIALGKTNWEISQVLGLSVETIKYHVKRINEIFATSSRSAAVAEAIRRGAMPDDWPDERAFV